MKVDGFTKFDLPIGRDKNITEIHKMCSYTNENCEKPRPASTGLSVLQYGYYDGQPATKVILVPFTGFL